MKPFFVALEPKSANYPELTKGLLVCPSSHTYNLLSFYELTKREQKDNSWDTEQEHLFIRHRGSVTALENFMRSDNLKQFGYEGFASDSFFSGLAIKLNQDCETCSLARVFSYSLGSAQEKGYKVHLYENA